MKIGIINNTYKPFDRGGSDRIATVIREALVVSGNSVFFITTRPYYEKFRPEPNTYYLPSLFMNLRYLPKYLRLVWHILDLFDFITIYRIAKILKKEQADLIVSNNLKGISGLLPLYLHYKRVKQVHVLHDLQLVHPSGLIKYGQEKILQNLSAKAWCLINSALYSTVKKVISPSKWLLDLHLKRGFFKNCIKQVVFNPIDFFTIEKTNDIGPERENYLYVGELVAHKGIEFLIRAFRELNAKSGQKPKKLSIIGSGELKDEILGINDDNIQYIGTRAHAEVLKIISERYCLIVPSLCYENSPTVIFEALTQSIPVIAANVGGIPEIINEYGGLLFKPNDNIGLFNAMQDLEKNYEKIKERIANNQEKMRRLSASCYIGNLFDF